MFFFRSFDKRKKQTIFLILLSGMIAMGLIVPSSTSEMDKKDGVIYLTTMPLHAGGDFESYDTVIWKAAVMHRVDYALVKAVIKTESNFNPQAVSRSGAKGLMQLMPGTADALGVDNSFHPEDNIQGGVRHLRYLLDRFQGNLPLTLAAYNAGEKVVLRCNGIPPYRETRKYIKQVLRYFKNYSSEPRTPESL